MIGTALHKTGGVNLDVSETMAHIEQMEFLALVRRRYASVFEGASILEIGSYDVNGSVRGHFLDAGVKEYIGVDLTPGPGVDVVRSGHELEYADGYFRVTISSECFEHNPYWLQTFGNMIRMTAPGGLVVMTCATLGRLEHGTRRSAASLSPGTSATGIDYYKNLTQQDFESRLELGNDFERHSFFHVRASHDLYFIGIRRGAMPSLPDPVSLFKEVRIIESASRRKMGFFKYSLYRIGYRFPLNSLFALMGESAFQRVGLVYHGLWLGLVRALLQKKL